MKLWKSKCERGGHDWFPNLPSMEFNPMMDVCLRCGAQRAVMPWGECARTWHPIAEHYQPTSTIPIPTPGCTGPL